MDQPKVSEHEWMKIIVMDVIFEVSTVVKIQVENFWVVTSCTELRWR
jgi:hypothetical protein